jgi:hypothetical protein
LFKDVTENNLSALLHQTANNGRANAPSAPGNNGNLILQQESGGEIVSRH